MAKTRANSLNIDDLNLSPELLKRAQLFANFMGYGTNHTFYYFVIKWYKENVKSNGEVLDENDLEQFYTDVDDENYDGPVHRKVNEEIGKLVDSFTAPTQSAPQVENKQKGLKAKAQSAKEKQSAKKRGRPPGQGTPKPPRQSPPKIELWINDQYGVPVVEVVKGQTYVVNWKSENAIEVTNSQQFPNPILDSELNGSRPITANRLSNKTFSITVSNQTGNTKKGVVKVIVVNASAQQQPTPVQTRRTVRRPASASTAPRTQTTRVSRNVGPTSRMASANPILVDISKSLSNIVDILEKQTKFLSGVRRSQRRRQEDLRRRRRESALEEVKGGIKGVVESIITPLKGVFDRIWKFIIFTLLGRAFAEFMNWFNDPKNKEKVKTLTRFLKDFWPLIAGAAVYFLTPFGNFVNSTVKLLFGFTRLLLAHPVIATAALIAGIAIGITQLTGQNQAAREQSRRAPKVQRGEALDVPGVDIMNEKYKVPGIGGSSVSPTGPLKGVASGGEVFSGTVTSKIGITVRGAGPDTQLLPVEGGGNVVLQKEETVLQKGVREKMISTLGIDPLMFNKGPNANKPKTINGGLRAMKDGGVVGEMNPMISKEDYNTLLAIVTAEDYSNLQGRADVAQSIYNRLYASQKYGVNYLPLGGKPSIRNLILGKGQYQPAFAKDGGVSKDWLNIKDINTAAEALAKYKKISLKEALNQLKKTDEILRNAEYQQRAADHVKGRTYFFGTSQQGNMGKNDALRGPSHNFFSHWGTNDEVPSPYINERGKVAAPIPQNLLPKKPQNKKTSPANEKPWWDLTRFLPKNKPWWDPRSYGKKKSGGLIDSSFNSIKGEPVDKYPILAQAGEYVIPKLTVQRIGEGFFNSLVANTDRNSNAAKMGSIPRMYEFEPPSSTYSSMNQVMTLPPIVQSAGGQPIKDTGSAEIPSFPAISPLSVEARAMFVDIYGIIV